VKECDISRTSASLLEKVEEGDPIFTLSKSENDPPIQSEHRLDAKGFGKKALILAGIPPEETTECAHLLAAGCIKHFSAKCKPPDLGKIEVTTMDTQIRDNMVSATLFLFDIDEFNNVRMQELLKPDHKKGKQLPERIKWQSFAVLVYLFARIDDLHTCHSVPISLAAFRDFKKEDHDISRSGQSFTGSLPDVLLSYNIFARLLLGRRYSKDVMKRAFLVSAYGWSLFFDASDAVDPADVTTGLLHLRLGVPTRLGSRRTRIVDGPTDAELSSTKGIVLHEKPMIAFWPGVWSSRLTGSYIGNHGRDAFAVVQLFDWAREEKNSKSWKYAFREKMETCMRYSLLGPCGCNEEMTAEEDQAWIDEYLIGRNASGDGHMNPRARCQYPTHSQLGSYGMRGDLGSISPERIFNKETQASSASGSSTISTWFFYVASEGAARWLALDGMERLKLYEVSEYGYLLRGKDCCIPCAINQVKTHSLMLL
jgi:hypothetical protein